MPTFGVHNGAGPSPGYIVSSNDLVIRYCVVNVGQPIHQLGAVDATATVIGCLDLLETGLDLGLLPINDI